MRLSNWLALQRYRLQRWQTRRRRARWQFRYARAIGWHSNIGWFEAHTMAHGVLLDDPAIVRSDPTLTALRNLGIPEEDLA
jgi:hypothetical protein